ncbi:M55 family metallopeptidase, partial [Ruminococcaceae bacterium OttesenSCG-928-D13]|nr:M55 family metallopeptidase [Ruminococcaceae bacterium OttesenSCG-928-D13]
EGTAGITRWEETEPRDTKWFAYFQNQMSREVAAACEGALAAGATDILVKDAHDTGRNIDPSMLPRSVCINRAWSGNPFTMVAGLSEDFDALAFTGYHSGGGSDGNPLSHTSNTKLDCITINGQRASEFMVYSYCAGLMGVPVAFLSGDAALCEDARQFIPGITAVAVSKGSGNASTSSHPDDAVEMIREGMKQALKGDCSRCMVKMPKKFDVRVRYGDHPTAYSMSFYPGARQLDEKTIAFEHTDYNEVMRFFHFVI